MKKVLLLFAFLSFIGMQGFAQRTVTGTVTGADDGMGLPGVSILVKGTNVRTVTDLNGAYSISAPADATAIVFEFMGMETQEVAISGDVVNAMMKSSDIGIDEVIVVAYGTSKKSSFTGSASIVDAKVLEKRQVSNVTGALSGVTPGLQAANNNGQPGTSTKIRIRGVGSFNASSEPLFVVDGVPFDGDISSLSGSDIESVTVLKDAASNSLYGARGANGVIMINTKKGKSGKTLITFDAKVGINQRGVPEYDIMTNPSMYYEKYYEGIYNNQISAGSDPATAHIDANDMMFGTQGLDYNIYNVPAGQYLIGTDGKINPNATLGRVWDEDYYLINDDWYGEIFGKSQVRQEYNLSISGGSEKQSTYFSLNYLTDEGIISNSEFDRLTTRLNTDYQVRKWLKVGGNIGYTNYSSNYPADQSGLSSKNLFYVSRIVAPIYPLYVRDANGDILVDKNGITMYDYGTGEYPGLTRPVMSIANPVSDLKLDKREYKSNILAAKGYLNFDIIKGLKLQLIASYDYDNTNHMDKSNSFYGQSASYGGSIWRYAETTGSLVTQQLVSYEHSFDKHNFDALLGHETYLRKWNRVSGSKRNIYDPESEEISSGILNPQTSSFTNEYFVEGYFTRLQYNYNQKYFSSLSYRRDGSSRFAPENRWGNFWSVGASWLLNKESFVAGVSWLNMCKVKISYGAQGNDALLDDFGDPNYYPYLDQYEIYNNNDEFGVTEVYNGNKDITWETSYNFNAGIDFSLFGDKLSGSVEFFNRKVQDMLFYVKVSPSAGFPSYPDNLGSMKNKGVEFNLRGLVVKTDKILWSVYLNGTYYKNEILSLPDYMESSENGYPAAGSKVWQIGGSIYDWFMPIYVGVDDEGSPQWEINNADGTIGTTTDYAEASQYLNKGKPGSALPDLQGGFGTEVSAYGFDFSIALTYQLGGLTLDGTYQDLMHAGEASEAGTNWHKDILNSWTPLNSGSDIPRVDFGASQFNGTSDRFLISSSYLNINNITLGYTIPMNVVEKMKLSSLRVYLAIDNVALFSKRKGLDPRQNFSGTTDYIYSPIRTISGGLRLQF
jgi:TonB-linked SusC/RagA family outer membrane protein